MRSTLVQMGMPEIYLTIDVEWACREAVSDTLRLLDDRGYDVTGIDIQSSLIEENRRRAVREGIRGRFADFSSGREVSTVAAIDELLVLVEPAAIRLGIFEEVQRVRQIVQTGTSADHQLKIYDQTHDPRAVVDWLLGETCRDLS